MRKYGIDSFHFEVIAQCQTQDDANASEIILISQYQSNNKVFGYNQNEGGDGVMNGRKHSAETKKLISHLQLIKQLSKLDAGETIGIKNIGSDNHPWEATIRINHKKVCRCFKTETDAKDFYRNCLIKLINGQIPEIPPKKPFKGRNLGKKRTAEAKQKMSLSAMNRIY